VELSWEIEVLRVCLVAGGWIEGALPVEVVRVCRVLGRRCNPVEDDCSVGVLEPLRRGAALWLSEVSGGLLTVDLLLSELNGGLVVKDRGGGRIEPSFGPGWALAGAVRCDKLPARVSRDDEELELGGLMGSLLGDWLPFLVGSMASPLRLRVTGAS
jgi:hypothetical protein